MIVAIVLFWKPIVDDIDIESHSFSILAVALVLSAVCVANRPNYLPESPTSSLSNLCSQPVQWD